MPENLSPDGTPYWEFDPSPGGRVLLVPERLATWRSVWRAGFWGGMGVGFTAGFLLAAMITFLAMHFG